MKVSIKRWHAIAQWRWDIGSAEADSEDADGEGDVCGICRVPYEGCCPSCKMPGDDCPLSECFYFIQPLLFPTEGFCQSGANAPMCFICIVFSSGLVQQRLSSNVQWTEELGVRHHQTESI